MTTIRQLIESMLVDHCLWDNEATSIVKEAEELEALESMKGRWDEDTSGLPKELFISVWMSVKLHAIKWLKENHPEHFAIGILEAA